MTLLTVKDVTKFYSPQVRALHKVNLKVEEGEFVSIIGPSGSGKSTLLRCVNRMIDATEGTITFDHMDVHAMKRSNLRNLRKRIGMIFQHYNLVDRLTVLENALHGRLGYKTTMQGVMGLYTRQEKENAFRILSFLGLNDQVYKRCDQLSGGQKQRVGIARALIQEPKLILCDEPIASLDPTTSKVIMDHLRYICSEMGITCMVNLHQVNVAMKYSDRIIGIRNGEVVYDGSPELSVADVKDIYGSEASEMILDLQSERKTAASVEKRPVIQEGLVVHVGV